MIQPFQFRNFAVTKKNEDDAPPEKKTRSRAKKTIEPIEGEAGEIAKPKRMRKSKTS